jgi:hypothetical protein
VLLSTPIPTREILRQKLAGVKKVSRVMAIPLLTVLIYDLWMRYPHVSFLNASWQTWREVGWQFLQGVAPIIVYPAIVAWLGFHCGMRTRNQGQAMLMTLAIIVAWCVVPVLADNVNGYFGREFFGISGWMTFNPLIYIIDPLRYEMMHRHGWVSYQWNYQPRADQWLAERNAFVIHFGTLLIVWLFLRWRGFATFGRLLKRNDGMPEKEEP